MIVHVRVCYISLTMRIQCILHTILLFDGISCTHFMLTEWNNNIIDGGKNKVSKNKTGVACVVVFFLLFCFRWSCDAFGKTSDIKFRDKRIRAIDKRAVMWRIIADSLKTFFIGHNKNLHLYHIVRINTMRVQAVLMHRLCGLSTFEMHLRLHELEHFTQMNAL